MKIMAIMLGPSGVGLFSLLRHTQQTATAMATFGGQTALVQGIASRDGAAKRRYVYTVFWYFVVGAAGISVLLVAFAPLLAPTLLGRKDVTSVRMVRWLAVPVILGGVVAFLSGVLNGFRAIGRLALVNVAMSATMAVFAYPVAQVVASGQPMALVCLLSVGLGAGAILAGIVVLRGGWLNVSLNRVWVPLDGEASRHFVRIGGVTLVTSLAQMGTILAIRAFIVHQSGFAGAGIFDVAWTLSMVYVMLALTSFGTYYLPTLSGITDPEEREALILATLRFTTLVMVPLVTSVIVLRPLVVRLFYSTQCLPSVKIMRWMLIGDYFRTASWALAMPMLAYADMKTFFWSEMLWNLCFAALSLGALSVLGGDLQWVGVAFLISYLCYFIYALVYVSSRFEIRIPRRAVMQFLAGFAIVVAVSGVAWESDYVNWVWGPVFVFGALVFSGTMLTVEERKAVARIVAKHVEWPNDRAR